MEYKNALNLLAGILLVAVALSAVPSAHAQPCSLAGTAGRWGYTYTGTIVLPTGGLPVAAVGRFTLEADGNLSGTQTRSSWLWCSTMTQGNYVRSLNRSR